MIRKLKILISICGIIAIFGIVGCADKEAQEAEQAAIDAQTIYTYDINDGLHVVIGFGEWGDDGRFHILSVTGKPWDVAPDVKIEQSIPTREDIFRQTK
jgi:hypothetical protein